ncbi:cysteine peptidase family C39 domain-containing protein [Herbaspirillum rubrisubalbicans]|uniref:cysteine peptidase family C39 domain-containing protein n=1 Tax=Herbaspirillum rubrisubalbicans TaxID=80842 RepID=UPI003CC5F9E1
MIDCWNPSAISLRQKLRQTTTAGSPAILQCRHNLNQIASAKVGAVQSVNCCGVAAYRGEQGHFVVVDGVTVREGKSVVAIRDPADGTQFFVPSEVFKKQFNGYVIFTNKIR